MSDADAQKRSMTSLNIRRNRIVACKVQRLNLDPWQAAGCSISEIDEAIGHLDSLVAVPIPNMCLPLKEPPGAI